jgi:hypothetical protein
MAASNLFEKSIALSLEIGKIGTRKKVSRGKMVLREGEGEQPDQEAIGVSKELIDSPEFDAITQLDGSIRNELAKLSLPSPFRKGIYLIPLNLVQRVDAKISNYKSDRAQLIDAFINSYAEAVFSARARLGGLFNGDDYAAAEDVRAAFTVESNYMDLGLPKQLGTINKEIFEREAKAFEAKLTSAADEIQAAMRIAFKELIEHMADRLKPGEDGKPRIFRDTLVLNLKEFMDNFAARNIADDADLKALVDQASAILGNKSAEELRKSPAYRQDIAKGLSTIKEKLDGMVVCAPIRKFSFDDEPTATPAAA